MYGKHGLIVNVPNMMFLAPIPVTKIYYYMWVCEGIKKGNYQEEEVEVEL